MIIIVDIESDGPCPGIYSMIQYGAVCIYNNQIMGKVSRSLKAITDNFVPEALNAIGVSREQTLNFGNVNIAIQDLEEFVVRHMQNSKSKAKFYSDNNGFDWQFINYYFHKFGSGSGNPFGFSSNNISNFYGGLNKKLVDYDWKKYRITSHSHDALSDALGNAEALLTICKQYGIKL